MISSLQNQTRKLRHVGTAFHRIVGRESIWVPIGRILALLASVFAVRVLTELVSPEEYGRLSLVTGLISLVSLVIYTSLGKSANRYIWDHVNQDNGNIWVSAVLLSYICFGFFCSLILWGVMALGLNLGVMASVAAWTIPIYLVAGALSAGILGMLNTLQEHRIFVIGTVIYAWLTPGLAILVVVLLAPTAESILIGYAGSAALMILATLWYMCKRGRCQFSFHLASMVPLLSKLLRYAAPLMLVNLFYWTQVTGNRYVLNLTLGVQRVGVFVVAAAVARIPIQSVESVFSQVHQPILFAKIGQQDGQEVEVSIRKSAFSDYVVSFSITTLPVLWFTIFGASFLMRMLTAQAYWSGAVIIPWVALAEFLRALVAAVTMAFEVERRPRSLIVPIAAASLVTLFLTYFLSRVQGVFGAGIALAAGMVVWLVLIWFPASRLACWRFSWISFFVALSLSILLAGVAWLSARLVMNLDILAQSAVFAAVFAFGYLLYAGRKLLG